MNVIHQESFAGLGGQDELVLLDWHSLSSQLQMPDLQSPYRHCWRREAVLFQPSLLSMQISLEALQEVEPYPNTFTD